MHSLISPSSAHRWVKCTRSVPLSRNITPTDNEAALEGTAAHHLAERMLHERQRGFKSPCYGDVVGSLAENGVQITDEMFTCAEEYAEYCANLMREASVFGGDSMGIESTIEIPKVHEECFGTCDFWLYDTHKGVLHVCDFKYGFRPVSPVENWQLICYAVGLLGHLNGIQDRLVTLKFHIFQPRNYRSKSSRTWSCQLSELRGHINILNGAAAEAVRGDGACVTGSWCADCDVMLNCEASIEAGQNAIDLVKKKGDVIAADGDVLGREIKALRQAFQTVEFRLEAAEAEGMVRIEKGERVFGHEVGHTRGSTKWTKPVSEIIAFGDLMKVDLRNTKVITPKQAMTAGIDETVVAQFSEKKNGKLKLVETNEKLIKEVLQND